MGDAKDQDEQQKDGAPEEGAEGNVEGGAEGGRRRRRPRTPEWVPEGDETALEALAFVRDVLGHMGFDCKARLRKPEVEEENPEIIIEIVGNDSARVIGKKGQVLTALQFLTHRAINRPTKPRRHVLVDAEGYRSRRDEALSSMAKKLGKQAVDEGKIITFEPMNPRERRVVHLALAKFEGVITRSDGEGEDRRVQIIPVRRGA